LVTDKRLSLFPHLLPFFLDPFLLFSPAAMSEEPASQCRRGDDEPPSWALPLFALTADVRELRQRLEALSLAPNRPSLPTYPAEVTAPALSDLAADPRSPPMAVPFLLAMAAALPTLLDEATVATFQRAYEHALTLHQSPPPAGPSGHRSRTPSRFVTVNGRQHYVTNQGVQYDIAQPPPRPCRACGAMHWSWQCPAQSSRTPPTQNLFQRNSSTGGGAAVQPTSH
jgi:hypothetical protein